jgi:hypothetical protein
MQEYPMKKLIQAAAAASLIVAPTAMRLQPVFQRLSDEGNWPYHC